MVAQGLPEMGRGHWHTPLNASSQAQPNSPAACNAHGPQPPQPGNTPTQPSKPTPRIFL